MREGGLFLSAAGGPTPRPASAQSDRNEDALPGCEAPPLSPAELHATEGIEGELILIQQTSSLTPWQNTQVRHIINNFISSWNIMYDHNIRIFRYRSFEQNLHPQTGLSPEKWVW